MLDKKPSAVMRSKLAKVRNWEPRFLFHNVLNQEFFHLSIDRYLSCSVRHYIGLSVSFSLYISISLTLSPLPSPLSLSLSLTYFLLKALSAQGLHGDAIAELHLVLAMQPKDVAEVTLVSTFSLLHRMRRSVINFTGRCCCCNIILLHL